MSFITRLASWWEARKPKSLDRLLAVDFDEVQVRVRVLERLSPDWNQTFQWSEIDRVCFKDAGLYSSDALFIELKGREKPAVVLIEAARGTAFFGALCDRGYFPEKVWRQAMAETGGRVHCWPEKQNGA